MPDECIMKNSELAFLKNELSDEVSFFASVKESVKVYNKSVQSFQVGVVRCAQSDSKGLSPKLAPSEGKYKNE